MDKKIYTRKEMIQIFKENNIYKYVPEINEQKEFYGVTYSKNNKVIYAYTDNPYNSPRPRPFYDVTRFNDFKDFIFGEIFNKDMELYENIEGALVRANFFRYAQKNHHMDCDELNKTTSYINKSNELLRYIREVEISENIDIDKIKKVYTNLFENSNN